MTIAEWRLHVTTVADTPRRSAISIIGGYAVMSLLAGFGIWQVVTYDKALAVQSQFQAVQVVTGPEMVVSEPGFQRSAETLAGEAAPPINLVLAVTNENALIRTMERAGWIMTTAPSAARLVDSGIAIIRDEVTPHKDALSAVPVGNAK
ncbi:MAG: hypothetical protein WBN04_05415 [Paracoccaceae bacterium]